MKLSADAGPVDATTVPIGFEKLRIFVVCTARSETLETVLVHELTHIARYDTRTVAPASWARTATWVMASRPCRSA